MVDTTTKVAPVFTTKFSLGKRTFYFEVGKAKDTPWQLAIRSTEAGNWKRQSLVVHEHEVQEFCQAVADASSFILNR